MRPETEVLINLGETYYQSLINDIEKAQHSIDFEVYMFNHDAVGKQVLQALTSAQQRGVKVRIIVDGIGSPRWHTCAKILDKAHVDNKIYHPYPWQWWHWKRSGLRHSWFKIRWARLLARINRRDHRKMVLIDNNIAIIGSFNVSCCHLSRQSGGNAWRDTAVRCGNTDISALQEAFEFTWQEHSISEHIHDAFRRVRKQIHFRLNNTLYRRRALHRDLLRRLRRANKRIYITNAYFLPNQRLLRHLLDASQRGVQVTIILPRNMDVPLSRWAAESFYYQLLKAGIALYDYLPSMLHAKTLIIDDWMLVGSSNLNHRSILHDLEVNAVLQTKQAQQQLLEQFKEDQAQSLKLNMEHWQQRRWHQRLLGRLILYFKYIM